MAISSKHLNEGERVVFSTRTHPKALLWPIVFAIVVVVVAALITAHVHGTARLVLWIAAIVAIVVVSGAPTLRWLGATYTATDRRLITRTGVLTRRGHDIPINRISDVSSERGLLDRVLGCGTLVVSDASTHGRVALPDVPDVDKRQLQLSELLYDESRGDDDRT